MHPFVRRRRVDERPPIPLPTRELEPEPEEVLPFQLRNLRGEVREEFREADRFGRAKG